ncbi:helix-turn-helix transcriptional regulator [Paenibacillus spongiae]|uniref:Transcriptional regulator n=1 Tax=Paenibacillus spongiae TaxID=2909671 RepID=A0ABY5SC75_9BACL|nr:metalloregulator ArsR/SmtB family transcription factor [Paenibacillus spongiae]UVI31554.1 transcriptional regulator [Paenibacillus spongiae]
MEPRDDLSTRETILHLLKTNDELSAKELTERLNITLMAVRRHIDVLERDGLVDSRTVRQPMGRPASVFRLTSKADALFPSKYHAVALDLLDELIQETEPGLVDRLFERRAHTLYNKYKDSLADKDLEGKVAALARIQNDNGYMAEWKKNSEDEFLLTEHNCPISQIAIQYKHVCRCELELFETLLDADIDRPECLSQGATKCAYTIRRRGSSSEAAL